MIMIPRKHQLRLTEISSSKDLDINTVRGPLVRKMGSSLIR